jgi:hypothetical protein
MKRLVVIFLCASLLLEGCYSLCTLNEDERGQLCSIEADDIVVTLNDGSKIESQPYHHFWITEPSDIILGEGSAWKSLAKQHIDYTSLFRGRLQWSFIDSSKPLITASQHHLRCWLRDSSVLTFKQGDYIILTPDSDTGFWILGTKNDTAFTGRVMPESIKEIETSRISTVKTALLLTTLGAVIAMGASGPFNFGDWSKVQWVKFPSK